MRAQIKAEVVKDYSVKQILAVTDRTMKEQRRVCLDSRRAHIQGSLPCFNRKRVDEFQENWRQSDARCDTVRNRSITYRVPESKDD